eukprot:3263599-Prymnesium_polylepis.1
MVLVDGQPLPPLCAPPGTGRERRLLMPRPQARSAPKPPPSPWHLPRPQRAAPPRPQPLLVLWPLAWWRHCIGSGGLVAEPLRNNSENKRSTSASAASAS